MPIPEANLLYPVDPSITDSDDWDIFVLSNARVSYESNGHLASLLVAYADTPLKVEGRLEAPTREQSHYLVNKPYKPTEMEIRNVNRYSYGEMEDGTIALWAQGAAGWFQIIPAPRYKPIFDNMIIAVQILYFVTDIHKESRKRGSGPSAQLLFQEYAEDRRFSCNDVTTAEATFNQHHIFLMMCFFNRANGISWSTTPLYQYFRRRHPEDFETCKARSEGRYIPIQASRPAPASAPMAHYPIEAGKPVIHQAAEAPKKDDNWWEAAALFEFMQKAVNQRALRVGRHQITLERVAELIVRRYEIEDVQTAQQVLQVHAQNLCYMMAHPRRKAIRYFASEPIYHTLAAGHNLSAAEQRRATSVELRPRKDHATLKDAASDSSETSDEEDHDAITTPVRRLPARSKKGRLSVLRPRSSNFSGKSANSEERKAGKGKAPVAHDREASEESDGSEQNRSSEDAMAIDTPTQALSPGLEKRKFDPTNTNEDDGQKRRGKRTVHPSKTPESPPTSVDLTDDDDDEPAAVAVPPIPLCGLSTNGNAAAMTTTARLVSTPLPTYQPNGPRDSWLCSFDGCSQRIYGCSKELGRRLITEHVEDHAKGTEKVVGILWREQDKLNLPVSNLIKKIRGMTEASTQLFPMTGTETRPPSSIKRPA